MRARFGQEAEDGNVSAWPQTHFVQPSIKRDRVHGFADENRSRPRIRPKQRVRRIETAALAGRATNVPTVVDRKAMDPHRTPVAGRDEIEIVSAKVWQRQPDPPVPERDEAFDRALDRRLEIGIDPRVARGRSRPPERNERFREPPQIVDPRIDALRVRNDQSVGEAALGQPTQGAETVVAAALQKDRKVETVLAEPALQPVQDGEEHCVDEGVVRAAGDDHGDQIGPATPQAPP